jgi:hypothetical protein
MRQKSTTTPALSKHLVKNIRGATLKHYSAEEKLSGPYLERRSIRVENEPQLGKVPLASRRRTLAETFSPTRVAKACMPTLKESLSLGLERGKKQAIGLLEPSDSFFQSPDFRCAIKSVSPGLKPLDHQSILAKNASRIVQDNKSSKRIGKWPTQARDPTVLREKWRGKHPYALKGSLMSRRHELNEGAVVVCIID